MPPRTIGIRIIKLNFANFLIKLIYHLIFNDATVMALNFKNRTKVCLFEKIAVQILVNIFKTGYNSNVL